MPGYKTHVAWSSAVGVGLGFVAYTRFDVSLPQAVFGGALCALGGVLPDIDSDKSSAFERCMSTIAGTTSLLLANRLSFLDLEGEAVVLSSAFVYFLIFYGLGKIIQKITVHRGMCHSLVFAVIAGELIFILTSGATQLRLFKAACIFFGVLVHLTLDELFSVGLVRDSSSSRSSSQNSKSGFSTPHIKKSFGTALKLIDYKHMGATAFFYLVAAFLGHAAMNVQTMLEKIGDASAGEMRGVASIERVKALYPTQYDLSVVQWVAENDLVLSPSADDNKKWRELQELLSLAEPADAAPNAPPQNRDDQLTLLDVVNWDSLNNPNPQNNESTSSEPRRRRRRSRDSRDDDRRPSRRAPDSNNSSNASNQPRGAASKTRSTFRAQFLSRWELCHDPFFRSPSRRRSF